MNMQEVESLLAKLPCVYRHRVLYGEVDKMNFVYGSHYLTWFERARNEYLRLCGLPYTQVEAQGCILPVFDARVWYLSPATYDELLDFRCAVTACTKASATFVFLITSGERRIAAGYTSHACLNPSRRPIRVPDWLREKILERYDVLI